MSPKERIREYLCRTTNTTIEDDADIFDLGLVDSLFAVQLVMFVENEFAIVAGREDMHIRNFSSINALANFVETKLAMPGHAGTIDGLATER